MCNPAVFWQNTFISTVFFEGMENLDFTRFSGEGVGKRSPIWAYLVMFLLGAQNHGFLEGVSVVRTSLIQHRISERSPHSVFF